MKYLKIVLPIVLFSLLIIACKDKPKTATTSTTTPTTATDSTTAVVADAEDNIPVTEKTATPVTGKVVYINTDTLLEKYAYYKDLKKQLEAEAKKAESGLESRGKTYQNKVMDFQKRIAESQQKAPSLTQNELKKLEDELKAQEELLMQEEQTILSHRQSAAGKLADKEAELQKKLKKRVDVYLQKYCAEKGYDYVLTEGGLAGSVLYGNKALDVTQEVLAGLNAEYKK
ncbi:MAG: OmpH family outer membrane protein [Saprospiraceae bacterium]|nr:OmpH family outer membrane protein [Saprospiraceae bacterium]MBP7679578.1 OmpH family outer membrane protein [Saprospiraceae bacterium]